MFALLKGTGRLLPLLAASGLLYANIIPTQRVHFHRVYPMSANGHVAIQNLYGDVSITAWDRDEVLVEAIKRTADPHGAIDDAQVLVIPSACGLSIRTQYANTDTGHPTSVEYRITVPRSATLDQVTLINGALSLSGLAGSVTASAVNGNIKAEKMGGQADLSTVNGNLSAQFARVDASKHISLRSVNGPITLAIPSGTGASLSAHNQSGGIESEFGRAVRGNGGQELQTRVNQGGADIRLRNVNGKISIHSALEKTANCS